MYTFLTATVPEIDLSTVDFSGLMDTIVGLVPVLLPVVIGLLGIRKGISFIQSMLRGA